MPNDAVFDPPVEGTPETPPSPPPAAPTETPNIKDIIAAETGPLKEQLSQMNSFFAKLQEQAEAQLSTPTPTGDPEDWGSKFYQDPKGTVQKEIADQTLPALQQAASAMGKMLLEQQASKVDSEFGTGTWAEIFAPKLDPIVKGAIKSNPMSLMNSEAVENAVAIIRGNPNTFKSLTEKAASRAETSGKPDEAFLEAAVNRVVEMTGGMRKAPNGSGPKLNDPESQEILKLFAKETGTTPDTERLSKLMSTSGRSTSFSDWQNAVKEKK
jgi:hypothetical protein